MPENGGHAIHEPLVGSEIVAVLPLAGLSFQASTPAGLFNVESSHRWKHSATTTQVAGHRIKSFEPKPLEADLMSPQRWGLPRNTFN